MGRQKSDGREVPEGRRKAVVTGESRGGKAATVNEQTGQLALFGETAESPQGARARVGVDPSARKSKRVPKSSNGKGRSLSPITMEAIADEGNLKVAFAKVASNRGAPGPDGQSIQTVRKHLDAHVKRLNRTLLDGSYRVGDIRRVWIPKKSGGQRGLGIPNVMDRIVQQATYQLLSPHYEPDFHDWSHGFRPGRSCHTAIKKAKEHLEAGMEWVVDLDLSKFFDEVGHDRLMSRLERKVSDRRVLKLIRQMLRARVVMPDGVVMENKKGTPQGLQRSRGMTRGCLAEVTRGEICSAGMSHSRRRGAGDVECAVAAKEGGGLVVMCGQRSKLESADG